jgi:hypothetical protein
MKTPWPILVGASLGYNDDMVTTGYSGKPLIEKLGIKDGMTVAFFNPTEAYFTYLGQLPESLKFAQNTEEKVDFIHFFTTESDELEHQFPKLKNALKPNGLIWISWPKGSSKIPTDLNENLIRGIGLECGLVDVKVAAIDQDWSGLKFVFRLRDRQ